MGSLEVLGAEVGHGICKFAIDCNVLFDSPYALTDDTYVPTQFPGVMETLAAIKSRPFTRCVDISGMKLRTVMGRYSEFQTWLKVVDGQVVSPPEDDAIWFYMMNHAMAIISQRVDNNAPLGEFEPHVLDYHKMMQAKALRMFYYLILICARESRHGSYRDKLYDLYPEIQPWHKKFTHNTDSDVVQNAMINNAPDVTLGRFCDFVYDAFKMCSYGGGYGGKAWADCAHPLREFVWGRMTAEMLMDTAFTLCHNNGPIFNKGMLYQMYSSEIKRILDVQSAGMIPQLVESKASDYVTPKHKERHAQLKALIGTEFGGAVDWDKVEKLGSKESYGHLKGKKPKATVTEPEVPVAVPKYLTMKADALAKKAAQEKAEFLAKNFEILPGVWVKKSGRTNVKA